jgi:hypothetical protein
MSMLARTLDAGAPAAWVTGDEVYGACPKLRAELEARGVGDVLAVARNHPVPVAGAIHRADALLRQVSARAWQCISAGKGTKCPRTPSHVVRRTASRVGPCRARSHLCPE